ncbi:carbamoyl-phosphate synthase L chain, ATP binding domain-containing protein [Rhexocercosporidium sp. MPI-PUGE-AT-0058]|nr:carbamoyl-phosphate synthase L chain, ATP binding domain-containing protein [Rhexocercosporidium sp. MPI-PUGE-AT-0058]
MVANTETEHRPLWLAPTLIRDDGTRRINSVLIANRGEIACRVIATCRKLQIRTIALYALEDSESDYVRDADEAICVGSIQHASQNPFLNITRLVETAQAAKADAVHPGYGYLSENSNFADAVRAAGILFLGPTSFAINTLGDKRQAKEYLAEHEPSVPLIPGYTGSSSTGIELADLDRESERIGYPVMIKASAGGGGKGLRIVHDWKSLEDEFNRARSEAQRSFGLSDCILEKYIEAGKHVEVQIVGDSHGNVISLWERDCSVQRRHQKVVEESPCPYLSQEKRGQICAVAVRIGKLLRYEGAGTVEFILDIATGEFYFLEVNARIQVEHPITEECTGLDIVALQLFVASGGNLQDELRLQDIKQVGHSIECRLCAEDPMRDFSPQHGPVHLWYTPSGLSNVRFETAIRTGSRISIYFDSMIAKIIVWAPSRTMAIEKMMQVLSEIACIGPSTNQAFLRNCLLLSDFKSGNYTTSLIPKNLETLLVSQPRPGFNLNPRLLAAMPCLLVRALRREDGRNRGPAAFSSIRRGYRNQVFDRVNNPADIITAYSRAQGTETAPQICLWSYKQQSLNLGHTARLAPLPHAPVESDQDKTDPAAATKAYNKLTRLLRTGDLPDLEKFDVKLLRLSPYSHDKTFGHIFSIEAFVGDTKVSGHVFISDSLSATSDPDVAGYLQVFCHFPVLGYPIEYHLYSMLSYFESRRRETSNAGTEVALGIIKAPMPCKVLQIVKKNDEQVKKGEIVMTIESMKMQISIVASKDGRFEVAVEEGDAVDEGSKLCSFT